MSETAAPPKVREQKRTVAPLEARLLLKAPRLRGKIRRVLGKDHRINDEPQASDLPDYSRTQALEEITTQAESMTLVDLLLSPQKFQELSANVGAIVHSFHDVDDATEAEKDAINKARSALEASQQRRDDYVAVLAKLRMVDSLKSKLADLTTNQDNQEISALLSIVGDLDNSLSPEGFLAGLAILGNDRKVIGGSAPNINKLITNYLGQYSKTNPNANIPVWFKEVMVQMASNRLLDHLSNNNNLTTIELLNALKALGEYQFDHDLKAASFYDLLSEQITAGSFDVSQFSNTLIAELVQRVVDNDSKSSSTVESVPPINWPEQSWVQFFEIRGLLRDRNKAKEMLEKLMGRQITQSLSNSARAVAMYEAPYGFRIAVGRNPDRAEIQSLTIDNGFNNVSRMQAILIFEPVSDTGEPQRYKIKNLSDKETLVVNGRTLNKNEEVELKNGDLIILGGDFGVPVLFDGSFFTVNGEDVSLNIHQPYYESLQAEILQRFPDLKENSAEHQSTFNLSDVFPNGSRTLPLGGEVGDANNSTLNALQKGIGANPVGTLNFYGFIRRRFGVTLNLSSTVTLKRGSSESGLNRGFTSLEVGDELIFSQSGKKLILKIDKIPK